MSAGSSVAAVIAAILGFAWLSIAITGSSEWGVGVFVAVLITFLCQQQDKPFAAASSAHHHPRRSSSSYESQAPDAVMPARMQRASPNAAASFPRASNKDVWAPRMGSMATDRFK